MRNHAYPALVIATLCWGGNAVAGKMALGHVSPMMLGFWRWLLAFLLVTAFSLPQIRKDWPQVRKALPVLAFYGIVGYAAFNGFLYTALTFTSAINAAVLQTMIPLLIFVFNFLIFGLRVNGAQLLGFSLTLLAGVVTAAEGDVARLVALQFNIGDGLMLLAVASYAAYTVALRWRPKIGWQTLMAVPAFFAAAAHLPMLAVEQAVGADRFPDAEGWLIIVYTAIFASLLAQVLFIRGVTLIGANRAGLFINLVPVFGTLLSVALLGESLRGFHLAALALALCGIALAERGKPAA